MRRSVPCPDYNNLVFQRPQICDLLWNAWWVRQEHASKGGAKTGDGLESTTWHYPPDLVERIVDTLPRLVKGKQSLLAFFEGAGVSDTILDPLRQIVRKNPDAIKKFEIARRVIRDVNSEGPSALRTRREIVKRIVEFTAFDQCYENDAMAARGGVAAIKELVALKDNVTRTIDAARTMREQAIADAEKRASEIRKKRADRDAISVDLGVLFTLQDPVARGKALEILLNRLFVVEGISVRQPFRLVSTDGDGVLEQVDGVIEFDGNHYLVEIKWWNAALTVGDVAQHMMRVFHRGQGRGLFIVNPGYTAAAVESVRKSLQKAPFVLATIEELIHVFRTETSVPDWLRAKVTAAIADENPFQKFSG